MTRLHTPIHLRWGDLDAFGHVNNATVTKLLEEARVRAFWKHERPEANTEVAVFDPDLRVGEEGPYFTLIAHQDITYLAPIPYAQDPIDIQIWFTKIGGSSAHIAYEIHGTSDDRDVLFGRASTVLVLVSQETMRPVRLPDEAREKWAPYLEAA